MTAKKAPAAKAAVKKNKAKAAMKNMSKAAPIAADSPSRLIDEKISRLNDWRGQTLARLRTLISESVPGVAETMKWRKPSNPAGVPIWEKDGILCTGETYKDKVKLTFARGAALKDPSGLFNSSLDGAVRRAIDLREGDKLNEKAFKALVREAAALNAEKTAAGSTRARKKPGG